MADDVAAQTKLVRAELAVGSTAILISPVIGSSASEMVALIHAAGIQLAYFIDSIAEDDRAVTPFIGDDLAVGQILSEAIARAVPKGRIVIIGRYLETGTNLLRQEELSGELSRHPDLTVAATQPGHYQRAPAKVAVADWLAAENSPGARDRGVQRSDGP